MKEILIVLILTNNQMQKNFLRTSSRVLRGSQILKSSIIADENNLEDSKREQKKNPTQGLGSSNRSFGIDFRISNGRLNSKDEERIGMVTLGAEHQKGRKMGKTKSTRKHLL
jgi:hypothetical protein